MKQKAEVRAVRETLKTLVNMQIWLDATSAELDARISMLESIDKITAATSSSPEEIAAYAAERTAYDQPY